MPPEVLFLVSLALFGVVLLGLVLVSSRWRIMRALARLLFALSAIAFLATGLLLRFPLYDCPPRESRIPVPDAALQAGPPAPRAPSSCRVFPGTMFTQRQEQPRSSGG